MFRRNRQAARRRPAARVSQEKITDEIKVKIKPARDGADEIFRLLQPLEPGDQPVAGRMILQVKQRGDHLVSTGSTGGAAGGGRLPPAPGKISPRLSSPVDPENFSASSASVPSMTFLPSFKIRMRELISSTRCSRCELMMMAAPSRARFRMEFFIRRMPMGSS